MLNFNSLLLSSENPKELILFYKKVFQAEPEWTGGEFVSFKAGSGYFVIGPHDKVRGKSANPERIIVNFETNDVQGEFERIKKLGAEVIADPYHPSEAEEMTLATLVDLDGNYFQLATPMPLA